MTSPRQELPADLDGCHALIGQCRQELHAARTRIESLESAVSVVAAHSAHLEALVAQYQETIADQQQTIDNLAADNTLLRRSLFGSRRTETIRHTDFRNYPTMSDTQISIPSAPDLGQ